MMHLNVYLVDNIDMNIKTTKSRGSMYKIKIYLSNKNTDLASQIDDNFVARGVEYIPRPRDRWVWIM